MKWKEMIDVNRKVIRKLKKISASDFDSEVRNIAEKLGTFFPKIFFVFISSIILFPSV